ncbi:MAG: hypothetical protein WC333_01980 [Dehalococcoidia bacterium]|jgi:hypothetical protein
MFKNPFKKKRKEKPICRHYNNFRLLKDFTDGGVPYLDHECYDCGYRFSGRVHVKPEDWKSRFVCAEEGFILINRIPETKHKKVLCIVIPMLFLILNSCVQVVEKGPFTCESKVINRHHEDAKTEYGYHYGYSIMKGKTCYHYGDYDVPEENEITYIFLGDTLTTNNKELYNKDHLFITYMKIYHVEKEDTSFSHIRVIDTQ